MWFKSTPRAFSMAPSSHPPSPSYPCLTNSFLLLISPAGSVSGYVAASLSQNSTFAPNIIQSHTSSNGAIARGTSSLPNPSSPVSAGSTLPARAPITSPIDHASSCDPDPALMPPPPPQLIQDQPTEE